MPKSDPNDLVDEPVLSSPQEREAEVEELKRQSDIQKALKQTAGQPQPSPTVEKKQKVFFGTYVVVLLLPGGLYYFLRSYVLNIGLFLPRAVLGAIAIATVITVVKSISTKHKVQRTN